MEHAVPAPVLALMLESPRLLLARVAAPGVVMAVVVEDHKRLLVAKTATPGVVMAVVAADHTRSPRHHVELPPRRDDVV